MKKAVIVIDMPEHCDDCPFRVLWAKYHCVVNGKFCGDEQGFYSSLTKPSWCPLRPLPEKWEKENALDKQIEQWEFDDDMDWQTIQREQGNEQEDRT